MRLQVINNNLARKVTFNIPDRLIVSAETPLEITRYEGRGYVGHIEDIFNENRDGISYVCVGVKSNAGGEFFLPLKVKEITKLFDIYQSFSDTQLFIRDLLGKSAIKIMNMNKGGYITGIIPIVKDLPLDLRLYIHFTNRPISQYKLSPTLF